MPTKSISFGPGDVLQVAAEGETLSVFVTSGPGCITEGFSAIRSTNPWGPKAAGFFLSGRRDELVRNRQEIDACAVRFDSSQVVQVLDPNPFACLQFAQK